MLNLKNLFSFSRWPEYLTNKHINKPEKPVKHADRYAEKKNFMLMLQVRREEN
jgi:hypothetical protein